jgi:hypothetical protein
LIDAGRLDLAGHVLDGMSSLQNVLVGRILLQPDATALDALLAPASLYRGLAETSAAEGEILGILARHAVHEDESLFLEGCLRRIANTEAQILARLRWTFSLLEEKGEKGTISPQRAVRTLEQAIGALESDERLVALVPELVLLSSFFGGARAIEEIHKAVGLLLVHSSIPWPPRREALERLLTDAPGILLSPGGDSGRAVGPLQVRALFQDLIGELTGYAMLADGENHYAEVLPVLVAVAERFPWPVELALEDLDEAYRTREDKLDDTLRVLALCAAGPDKRRAELDFLLEQAEPSPPLLQALAYLISGQDPERVLQILQLLPKGPDKDDFCRSLVQGLLIPTRICL